MKLRLGRNVHWGMKFRCVGTANLDYYSGSLCWSRHIVWSEVVSSAEFQGGPHPSSPCAPGCLLPAPCTFQQVARCSMPPAASISSLPISDISLIYWYIIYHTFFAHVQPVKTSSEFDVLFEVRVSLVSFVNYKSHKRTKKFECCVDISTCE